MSAPSFCRQCGTRLKPGSQFCPSCGKDVTMISRAGAGQALPPPPSGSSPAPQPGAQLPLKNPGAAAVIALVVGVLLFWGVGHIYAGKVMKGIGIMIAGWVVEGLFWLSFLGVIYGGIGAVAVIALFGLLAIGGWLWQTFDAYSLAKYYNDYVRTHGVEPW